MRQRRGWPRVYNRPVLRDLERQNSENRGGQSKQSASGHEGQVAQTRMKSWTGAATSSKVGQKGPRGHQMLQSRLPRMWGTNGGKEAARARQGARVGNGMKGRSQRAQSGHKTCGSTGLTALSDKALR
jgi:hypothetical protein